MGGLPTHFAWTDGSCEPNPGIGGWGFLSLCAEGKITERCGGYLQTTNNRMELIAVLEALKDVPDGTRITVFSDSQYVVNGVNLWRHNWRRKGWSRGPEPVANLDLWLVIDEQCNRLQLTMHWVRGHNGDPGNERADQLANLGRLDVLV